MPSEIDVGAIRAAATAMTPLAPEVADTGDRTVRTWREIGTYYIAPETPVLVNALDPVGPLTRRTADRTTGLARALLTWADAAEPLLADLRRLQAEPEVSPGTVGRLDRLTAELAVVERDCAAAIRALTAFDPVPDRVRVTEQVDAGAVGFSIGFVTLGRGVTFKRTTFSDGSVTLTALNGGDLGAVGALGFVEVGGGVRIEAGSTWRFRSGAEADALQRQLTAYLVQEQMILLDDTGGAVTGVAIVGGVEPVRPPDLVVSEFGVTGGGGFRGDVGLAQGSLIGEGSETRTVIRDQATGATTTLTSREGSVDGSVAVTPLVAGPNAGGGVQTITGSANGVTRDAAGRITRVVLTATESGQGTVAGNLAGPRDELGGRHRAPTVDPTGSLGVTRSSATVTATTTALDVTDANRAAVEQWVAAGQPDGDGAVGDPGLHHPARPVPGDAFQNALHERARVTRVTYDDVTDTAGFTAEIKAGWKFGVEGSYESTSSRAAAASYLDAPGADGTRPEVPFVLPD